MSDPANRDATALYQAGDFIALALGRLAAERLTSEHVAAFRAQIEEQRAKLGDSAPLLAWDRIIASGFDDIRQAFTEPTERGQQLRSVVSFRPFVSKIERDEIFRRHTREFVQQP